MVGIEQIVFRHHFEQFFFHFRGVLPRRKARAVADAENVGIHSYGRLAESDVHDNIGRLAADAGKTDELIAGAGYFAVKPIDQDAAGLNEVLCLGAVKINRLNVGDETVQPQIEDFLRRIGDRKEFCGCKIHAFVRCLRREHHGNEQLKGR